MFLINDSLQCLLQCYNSLFYFLYPICDELSAWADISIVREWSFFNMGGGGLVDWGGCGILTPPRGGPKKCHPFSAKKPAHYYSSKGSAQHFLTPPEGGGLKNFAHSCENLPTSPVVKKRPLPKFG